jgi:hypothetical protein
MTLLDGVYGIVGPVCLDAKVKKQPATQSNEAFAARVDAFASTADYTKTYRFVHNDIYSNLHLILLDPAGLVESMTAPDEAVPVMGAEKEEEGRNLISVSTDGDAAGCRDRSNGSLGYRGIKSCYWTSTARTNQTNGGRGLFFDDTYASLGNGNRGWGMSIRCVQAEF